MNDKSSLEDIDANFKDESFAINNNSSAVNESNAVVDESSINIKEALALQNAAALAPQAKGGKGQGKE